MMRALYARYLALLNLMDEEELHDRCIDGSASTTWAVMAREQIDARQRRIDELRRPRMALMKEQA